jgi:hypothetical protein
MTTSRLGRQKTTSGSPQDDPTTISRLGAASASMSGALHDLPGSSFPVNHDLTSSRMVEKAPTTPVGAAAESHHDMGHIAKGLRLRRG